MSHQLKATRRDPDPPSWLPVPPSNTAILRTFRRDPAEAWELIHGWKDGLYSWIETVWSGQHLAVPPGREQRWCTGPDEGEFASEEEFTDFVYEEIDTDAPEEFLEGLCRGRPHAARAIVRHLRFWRAPDDVLYPYRRHARARPRRTGHRPARRRGAGRPARAARAARQSAADGSDSDLADGDGEPPRRAAA